MRRRRAGVSVLIFSSGFWNGIKVKTNFAENVPNVPNH
jgi:hypothetical protein